MTGNTTYLNDKDLIMRLSEALKEASCIAASLQIVGITDDIEIVYNFSQCLSDAAAAATCLAHNQKRDEWLTIRTVLEKMTGNTLLLMKNTARYFAWGQQEKHLPKVQWIKISDNLKTLATTCKQLAITAPSPRHILLEQLDVRKKSIPCQN